MDQPFTVTRLPHGVTMISDPAVHCFLVEGTRRAVLIDAMTGLRGLAALLPALTNLPVEVVATHGHIDHIGGVFELGGCALHPADAGLLDGQSLPARVAFMEDWTRPGQRVSGRPRAAENPPGANHLVLCVPRPDTGG